jgi:hypothetical protein
VLLYAWLYMADSGTVFKHDTMELVAEMIQFSFESRAATTPAGAQVHSSPPPRMRTACAWVPLAIEHGPILQKQVLAVAARLVPCHATSRPIGWSSVGSVACCECWCLAVCMMDYHAWLSPLQQSTRRNAAFIEDVERRRNRAGLHAAADPAAAPSCLSALPSRCNGPLRHLTAASHPSHPPTRSSLTRQQPAALLPRPTTH